MALRFEIIWPGVSLLFAFSFEWSICELLDIGSAFEWNLCDSRDGAFAFGMEALRFAWI